MSASRFSRVQKVVAVVPLALLSAAATASLANPVSSLPGTSAASSVGGERTDGTLPDGSSVPTQAIEAPASVSPDEAITGSVGGPTGDTRRIVATSSTNGIPSAALAAYQRAETVINAADASCRLSWQLIAAIGRVESDHGRYAGNALDAEGVATPGIYGPALDGKGAFALIRDTDAGQYDNDLTFDRAVGPMQFIPSTWSVVGVDADNDGIRNPQDIDDAALATAVYLCSGADDLSTLSGQREAVFRYNHSESYVDLVLSIADAYLEGDFTSVPNGTTAAGFLEPDPAKVQPPTRGGNDNSGNGNGSGSGTSGSPDGGDNGGPATGGDDGGEQPTKPPTGNQPGETPSEVPSEEPTDTPDVPTLPLPTVTVPPLPETGVEPVDEVLSTTQAVAQCLLEGKIDDLSRSDDPFDRCVKAYTS